jgi:hypothetical protein
MTHIDLEQLLRRELEQLPQPRAPLTLLPRVLAATTHPSVEQPRGAWLGWPRAWQLLSAAALVALVAGVWMLVQVLHPGDLLWRPGGEATTRVATAGRSAVDVVTLVRVLWQVVLQPLATYVSALGISLALACAVVWTAVERLALSEGSHR